MRRIYLFLLLLPLLAAVTMAGCQRSMANHGPQALHVAALAGPVTLNPVFIRDAVSAEAAALLHPQLLGTNPATLESEPRLVREWQISEDGRTYRLRLEEGLVWSDGEPLTSRDVAFTLRVICHSDYTGWMYPLLRYIEGAAEYRKERLSGHARGSISGVVPLDEYTLEIRLENPHAPFLSYLTFAPLPHHLLEDIAVEELEMHPYSRTVAVGAGPYLLEEWRQEEYLHLRANPRYYLGKPEIEEIYYRFIANPEAQMIELLAGKLDLIPTAVKVEDVTLLSEDPQVVIRENSRLVYDYIGFNSQKPYSPLKDRRVRQALSMLPDREALVGNLLLGHGEPLYGPLLPLHFPYDPDFVRAGGGLPAARTLLLEAGCPALKLKMIFNAGNIVREHAALLFKEQAAKVGVEIDLHIMEWESFLAAYNEGDYDLVLLGRGADADPDLSFHWHSAGPGNTLGYRNEEVDELLEAAAADTDPHSRSELYRRAQERIVEDAPMIWLYTRKAVHAMSAELENFEAHPESLFYNVHLWRLGGKGRP
jgi:peptide/nickel transport system substrate-binding protein